MVLDATKARKCKGPQNRLAKVLEAVSQRNSMSLKALGSKDWERQGQSTLLFVPVFCNVLQVLLRWRRMLRS